MIYRKIENIYAILESIEQKLKKTDRFNDELAVFTAKEKISTIETRTFHDQIEEEIHYSRMAIEEILMGNLKEEIQEILYTARMDAIISGRYDNENCIENIAREFEGGIK